MTDNLTTLISKTQARLGDDGTYFSTATITAAARAALDEINQVFPLHAEDLEAVVAEQLKYTLADEQYTSAIVIEDVLLNDSVGDEEEPLKFAWYRMDGTPVVRLQEAQSSGDLLIRYTLPQTVNGLDSETTSTLPAWAMPILVDGIAFHTLAIRGVARIEANNLNKSAPKDYASLRAMIEKKWYAGLERLGRFNHAPVSEPNSAAWNDRWYLQG